MNSYAEFLAAKDRRAAHIGQTIEPGALHPILRDHQRYGVEWAARVGRAAIFWDCGMGKTLAQLEWARVSADTSLILAPLSVARQTVREAPMVDIDARYVRSPDQINGPGVYVTNYEMAEAFDPKTFGAVVLDESSILKSVDGKTRRTLTELLSAVPLRLACSATPAPNDVSELTNHAEFLGAMKRAEMLAAYFINDGKNWRLKGHAHSAMFNWMATWAQAARRPSDLGFDDHGYELPPLNITAEYVEADVTPSEGQLFAADLGGVSGRAKVRRETMGARVTRAAELADDGNQWIIWTGMNAESDSCTETIDGAVNVEGSMSPEAKAEALEAFQDGDIRVLVTKPKIAGFGMNFQNCSRMAFVGLSDSYEAYYQAVRRCWRFGQSEPVHAHIVLSEIESQIAQNVQRKERESAQMVESLVRQMNQTKVAA